MKKIIIIVLSVAIVLGFLVWRFGPNLPSSSPIQNGPVELTFWGLWEEGNLIQPAIDLYVGQHPNVKITYVRQSSVNYRTRVQTQVRSGTGPDILMIHNSWLPMFQADLSPAPASEFNISQYEGTFYPVASSSFVKGSQIYGAPLEIDGLVMFYNPDMLAAVGAEIPKTWQEFIAAATKMTVRDETGRLQTAGAALGTTSNVDNWSDILGLMMLQQGVNLANPNSSDAAAVLRFYTNFVTDPKQKTWDATMPASTQAFAQGRVGFYFAPSWRAYDLKTINPNLNFKTAPVPQLPGGRQVAWASFWGYGVSAQSKHTEEAWKFIKFLTSAEVEKTLYAGASQVRLFGEPYSRQDLAGQLSGDPVVGAFVNQGNNYQFWYLESNTIDNGLNDEMIKYWEDGVNATLQGTDPQVALQTVAQGTQQVLSKYGVSGGQ